MLTSGDFSFLAESVASTVGTPQQSITKILARIRMNLRKPRGTGEGLRRHPDWLWILSVSTEQTRDVATTAADQAAYTTAMTPQWGTDSQSVRQQFPVRVSTEETAKAS